MVDGVGADTGLRSVRDTCQFPFGTLAALATICASRIFSRELAMNASAEVTSQRAWAARVQERRHRWPVLAGELGATRQHRQRGIARSDTLPSAGSVDPFVGSQHCRRACLSAVDVVITDVQARLSLNPPPAQLDPLASERGLDRRPPTDPPPETAIRPPFDAGKKKIRGREAGVSAVDPELIHTAVDPSLKHDIDQQRRSQRRLDVPGPPQPTAIGTAQ